MSLFTPQQTVTTQSQPNQPEWFNNHKKRTIPNHLAPKKKPGFHINSASKNNNTRRSISGSSDGSLPGGSTVSTKEQFNVLSFGSQQKKNISVTDRTVLFDETIDESFDLNQTNDDLPPTRSIYDLNDEILFSKPKQNVDSFISKDPKNFNNVFNRDVPAKVVEAVVTPKTIESAVLVFGYPENLSSQVIQYFKEFGDIMEEFEVGNFSSNSKAIIPIFSGKNWVKITYDNSNSAFDALQENGSVFNGILLGVIPYNKISIEKLKKRKLTDFEDFGKVDLGSYRKPSEGEVQGEVAVRLEIKDGSEFFLKATEEAKNVNVEKLGWGSLIARYLFGFHEL